MYIIKKPKIKMHQRKLGKLKIHEDLLTKKTAFSYHSFSLCTGKANSPEHFKGITITVFNC